MATERLLTQFYEAFTRRDAVAMTALYHPQAQFRDEVFRLQGRDEVGTMWDMLCTNGKDLSLTYTILSADDRSGEGEVLWVATYTFSATGRKVVNRIRAHFELRDGLIYRHDDRFNFWRWSCQALGLPGWLLGWSSWLNGKVARQAAGKLAAWRSQFRTTPGNGEA